MKITCGIIAFLIVAATINCDPVNQAKPNFVWLEDNTGLKICGGVLIDIDFALISATCLFDIGLNPYKVHQLKVVDVKNNKRNVKKVNINPKYNSKTFENNLAVLHIDAFETVHANSLLTVLNTPSSEKQCEIGGWDNGQMVGVTVSKKNDCATGEHILCVESPHKCLGSGSILVCNNEVAGIGAQCGKTNSESVFVDVSKYNNWIDDVFQKIVHNNGVPNDTAFKKSIEDFKKHKKPEEENKKPYNPKDPEKDTPKEKFPAEESEKLGKPKPVTPIDDSKRDDSSSKDEEENIEEDVKEICEECYRECVETWSTDSSGELQLKEKHCKRGYYPYSCVYSVKHFIMDKQELGPVSWIPPFLYWLNSFTDFLRYPATNYWYYSY